MESRKGLPSELINLQYQPQHWRDPQENLHIGEKLKFQHGFTGWLDWNEGKYVKHGVKTARMLVEDSAVADFEVVNTQRGKGLGKALMNVLIQRIAERGRFCIK